ncbi:MAG: sugar phosphate isomerase/epimerase [Bacteroidetes bacterium]|nr:sugar phosphate isomerase/epimerase [Bacteroidota bacterium]MCL5027084.1 sugar phosphate isomerase/epimerase [Chloroflexota bacterium]
MLFGCCTVSQNAALTKAIGYDFIEIEGRELAAEQDESAFTPVRDRLLAAGIPVRGFNKFFTSGIVFVGPNVDDARNRNYIEVSFARAKALGGQNIGWGSPASRKVPEGFPRERSLEQMREALLYMAGVAERCELNVLMESVTHKMESLILTVREATDMARSVGKPNVHVVADIYHMLHNDDPLESLKIPGEDLYHVHFTDLDRRSPGTNPEQRDMYLRSFEILREMGYDKSVSIEPDFVDFEAEARMALAVLHETHSQACALVGHH